MVNSPAVPAIVFPYWEPWNKSFRKLDEFCRVRLLDAPQAAGSFGVKPVRYLQPQGSLNGVYLPSGTSKGGAIDWSDVCSDVDKPLIITEGEKKAIKACKEGLWCVALGGVTMTSAEKKGMQHLEFFDKTVWGGRTVHIVFDTDNEHGMKPEVLKAADRLCHLLGRLGAKPILVTLPAAEGAKVGLDDYLCEHTTHDLAEVLSMGHEHDSAKLLLSLAEKYVYVRNLGRIFDSTSNELITDNHLRLTEGNKVVDRFVRKAVKANNQTVWGWVKGTEKAGTAFMEWQGRPQAETAHYVPGGEARTKDNINLWRGWKCGAPEKGDISPFLWCLDNVFGDHDVAREFIEHWLFYPIKNPGTKLYTISLVVSPDEGIGKTFPAEMLARHVYGALAPYQNASIIQEGDLGGSFNEYIVNRQFVLSDDVAGNEGYNHLAKVKSLVTSEVLPLKRKYMPEVMCRVYANLYLSANQMVAFKLSDDDRRFFVHWPTKARKDLERYNSIRKWFEGGGGKHILWYAQEKYNAGKFDPRAKAPDTPGREQMINLGKSDLETWVRDLKHQAQHLTRGFATPEELRGLYQLDNSLDNVNARQLGKILAAQSIPQWDNGKLVRVGKDGKARRVWIVRDKVKWLGAAPEELQAEMLKNPEFRWQTGPLSVVDGGKTREPTKKPAGKF